MDRRVPSLDMGPDFAWRTGNGAGVVMRGSWELDDEPNRQARNHGGNGLVILFGQGCLTEVGQQLIQSLRGHRLWSGDLDSDRPSGGT
jgi:hypothetical protein